MDASLDGSSDGGGWVCGDPDAAPYVPACTDEDKKKCQQWAQSLTPTGYAHASCTTADFGRCVAGDTCFSMPRSYCTCTTDLPQHPCWPGYVCVSDTPDGPRRCVKACGGSEADASFTDASAD